MDIDITDKVRFGGPDDESLPLTKCICGKEWLAWDGPILDWDKEGTKCPECGRKLYWRQTITVYEV